MFESEHSFNRLKGRGVNWLHFAHPGLTYMFNFWYAGTLALNHECRSVRNEKFRLDLDGI